MKQEKNDQENPKFAPAMEDDDLEESATPEEIEKGEYTEVTKLYLDRI